MTPEKSAEKPLRADARRNRARILEVAQEVFATEGLAAPVDEIALRAGVGVGTIYRHFPTKSALFAAILTHRIETIAAELREQADAPDPGAAFYAMFTQMIEHGMTNRALFEAMAAHADTDLLAVSTAHGTLLTDALDVLLTRAQDVGAVRTGITASDVKALMIGAHAIYRHHEGDPAATARAVEILTDGLRPPTPAHPKPIKG